jgi:hypothetical protein
MKQLEINIRPTASIYLDAESLDCLSVCSQAHYDGRCREASAAGGFIAMWDAYFRAHREHPDTGSGSATCSWNDADTCRKILENPPEGFIPRASQLYTFFSEVMRSLNLTSGYVTLEGIADHLCPSCLRSGTTFFYEPNPWDFCPAHEPGQTTS